MSSYEHKAAEGVAIGHDIADARQRARLRRQRKVEWDFSRQNEEPGDNGPLVIGGSLWPMWRPG